MLYLFLGLKIPLLLLYGLVYWAIKAEPEPEDAGGDGGSRKARPHPAPTLPRTPRRGPHGDPQPAAPARVRTVVAKAREHQP
jgi:hypothetical protein